MISEKFACASSDVSDIFAQLTPQVFPQTGLPDSLEQVLLPYSSCQKVIVVIVLYAQLQQVDLMGITIKSLAEIEKEVSHYSFTNIKYKTSVVLAVKTFYSPKLLLNTRELSSNYFHVWP